MSEDPETAAVAEQPQPLSHRRILGEMVVIVALSCLAGFLFVSERFGFGVLIGGILAFINYFWLKQSLKRIFDRAAYGERPRFLATKYVLRYFVFGAILLIVYLTETVSVGGVILGLASFALAVVTEGLIRIFSQIFK